MSFRLLVKRVSQLAGVLVLDGIVEEGIFHHGARARLDNGREVVVKTVAFVRRNQLEDREVTITIDGDVGKPDALPGTVLTGD